MAEVKRGKSKRTQTWKRHAGATDITLYRTNGSAVSSEIRKEFEQAALNVVLAHPEADGLILNIAVS